MQSQKSNVPSVDELLTDIEAAQSHMNDVRRFSDLRGVTEILSDSFKGMEKDLAFLKNVLGAEAGRKPVRSKQRLEVQAVLREILAIQRGN